MTTETQTPEDWVLLEAAKLCGRSHCSIETVRDRWHLDKTFRALCDMVEQHEAFKQEVSDTVESITNTAVDPTVWRKRVSDRLSVFIIPKPKPDPLVEVWHELFRDNYNWHEFIAALDARGLEIREKQP
jgi:hypothetical protein